MKVSHNTARRDGTLLSSYRSATPPGAAADGSREVGEVSA